MENFVFCNPTKLIFGKGQIKRLGSEISQFGSKVLIVTGGGTVKKIGLFDEVVDQLIQYNIAIFELAGVEPNPRLSTVEKGIDICKKEQIDFILAVGGGSVIDATKAIAAGAKYDGSVWDFYSRLETVKAALPLGTVLTLAATGSEMNEFSVVTNWNTKEKIGIGSNHFFPKFSILDPTYTYTVPKDQTIYGIADIMAHVFEQYFSHTTNTPMQDELCESVLRTVIKNAKTVIDEPDNYEARSNILISGTMGLNGMISMGMIGDWATHNIEHQLSAFYDIPHGGGLAILFPNWMRYVLDDGTDKLKQYAIRVWGVNPTDKNDKDIALEGIDKTREFFASIGAPTRLADYNIGNENIDIMAEKAVNGKYLGQFKKLYKEDVKNILLMSL